MFFYQLLVYNKFTKPEVYSKDMEADSSLITTSPAYAASAAAIDEYIELNDLFTSIFKSHTKMTKLLNKDKTEQITQIECSLAESMLFREHPSLERFQELRSTVGFDILGYRFNEKVLVKETPTETFTTFAKAKAAFNS